MPGINGFTLAAAFGGGLFGAAVGAFPAFILCALSLVIGIVIALVTGDGSFLTLVTWGPFLGPQSAFVGGTAAAAFAARKGLLPSGRNILVPLLSLKSMPVLLVGGVFGLGGNFLAGLLIQIPAEGPVPWINPIALSVVFSGMLIRIIFGRTGLFGRIAGEANRWSSLDKKDSFPWHLPILPLFLISLMVSLIASIVVLLIPGSTGLIFGLSALSVVLLLGGVKIPIFFHMALAGELYAAATGDLWWGVTMGISAGLLGEFFARLFLIHGDTHIDPPALSLTVICALSFPLLKLGLWRLPGFMALIFIGAAVLLSRFFPRSAKSLTT